MSRFRVGFDHEELSKFYRQWMRMYGDGRDKNSGGGLRFGQTLCNCYLRPGCAFPELFYVESAYEAHQIAYQELNADGFQGLPRC
jgi:hypothetical protein